MRCRLRRSPGSASARIDSAFNVFDVPFFFESYDELNDVTEKLTPAIAKRVEAKGFVLLNWGHGGWTQVFTKKPVRTVGRLKKVKLYTSAGNDRMVQWFKANGFQPRAMAMTDIMTGLTTGMIEGVPTTAAGGALVPVVPADAVHARHRPRAGRRRHGDDAQGVERRAEADRPKLLAAAAGVQKRLQDDVPKQDAAAVTRNDQSAASSSRKASGPEWRQEADVLAKTMRGEMVPPDMFDLAVKARDAYRKQHRAGAGQVIRRPRDD